VAFIVHWLRAKASIGLGRFRQGVGELGLFIDGGGAPSTLGSVASAVQIERRNRYSGLAAADDVDVLDVNEYRSSVTVAFKTTHDRGQVILGPDELAKDADVTRSRWTFDADTTRCVVRENASNLDPKAAERE
jgi:hypothetical protein